MVSTTLKGLNDGGVIVHCVGGTGRTGTVLGCVLRELGKSANEIIDCLDTIDKARDRKGWLSLYGKKNGEKVPTRVHSGESEVVSRSPILTF